MPKVKSLRSPSSLRMLIFDNEKKKWLSRNSQKMQSILRFRTHYRFHLDHSITIVNVDACRHSFHIVRPWNAIFLLRHSWIVCSKNENSLSRYGGEVRLPSNDTAGRLSLANNFPSRLKPPSVKLDFASNFAIQQPEA